MSLSIQPPLVSQRWIRPPPSLPPGDDHGPTTGSSSPSRVILVDPTGATREVIACRLRAQGYVVDETGDPAAGADMALRSPPAAVVADLWMPSISGIQLCRLLRSEPATVDVPVILCGEMYEPRNQFWADRAGATAYVAKQRTGDLVRALARVIVPSREDSFFCQLSGGTMDIRDRLARHLDAALFDSVIAAEVRALASCGGFERLFDLFAQFLSQVLRYRWAAIATEAPERFALHHHPRSRTDVEAEARLALGISHGAAAIRIEDEDALETPDGGPPIVRVIRFGNVVIGKIAVSLAGAADDGAAAAALVSLVAREVGGPIRMTTLVEESQRLAATDPLTGLLNRRAFSAAMALELARSARHRYPLSLLVLDVDHFKLINDRCGHRAGDQVLAALGGLLRGSLLRVTDLGARWGGEEFVVAYPSTPLSGAAVAAERVRAAIEQTLIVDEQGASIPLTASIGVAEMHGRETLEGLVDRADRAMYESKAAGRNRVTLSEPKHHGDDAVPTDPPRACHQEAGEPTSLWPEQRVVLPGPVDVRLAQRW